MNFLFLISENSNIIEIIEIPILFSNQISRQTFACRDMIC